MAAPHLLLLRLLDCWLGGFLVLLLLTFAIATVASTHVEIIMDCQELFLAFRNEREEVSLNEILTYIAEAGRSNR